MSLYAIANLRIFTLTVAIVDTTRRFGGVAISLNVRQAVAKKWRNREVSPPNAICWEFLEYISLKRNSFEVYGLDIALPYSQSATVAITFETLYLNCAELYIDAKLYVHVSY